MMDFSSMVEKRGETANVDDSSTHGTPFYMVPEVLDGEELGSAGGRERWTSRCSRRSWTESGDVRCTPSSSRLAARSS